MHLSWYCRIVVIKLKSFFDWLCKSLKLNLGYDSSDKNNDHKYGN